MLLVIVEYLTCTAGPRFVNCLRIVLFISALRMKDPVATIKQIAKMISRPTFINLPLFTSTLFYLNGCKGN